MSYPTSRRYPRSTSEAFADERAYCLEVYRPRRTGLRWLVLAILLAVALLALGGA